MDKITNFGGTFGIPKLTGCSLLGMIKLLIFLSNSCFYQEIFLFEYITVSYITYVIMNFGQRDGRGCVSFLHFFRKILL